MGLCWAQGQTEARQGQRRRDQSRQGNPQAPLAPCGQMGQGEERESDSRAAQVHQHIPQLAAAAGHHGLVIFVQPRQQSADKGRQAHPLSYPPGEKADGETDQQGQNEVQKHVCRLPDKEGQQLHCGGPGRFRRGGKGGRQQPQQPVQEPARQAAGYGGRLGGKAPDQAVPRRSGQQGQGLDPQIIPPHSSKLSRRVSTARRSSSRLARQVSSFLRTAARSVSSGSCRDFI